MKKQKKKGVKKNNNYNRQLTVNKTFEKRSAFMEWFISKLGLIVLTVVPAILAYFWFIPKISVSPTFSVNQQNILSTQFKVSNDGNTDIKDVESSIAICKIKTSVGGQIVGSQVNGNCDFKNRLKEPNTKENKRVPIMKRGEINTVQFPSNFIIGDGIDFADLAVVVNYKLPFLSFWAWEQLFRFTTVKDADGALHWNGQPLSK
mgnify:CR=1 FL=1